MNDALCDPARLNPRWDRALNKAWLASCVAIQVFNGETERKPIDIEIPNEIEDIYSDILLAARTCATAFSNQGTPSSNFESPFLNTAIVTLPWKLRDYEQSLTKMQNGFNIKAEAAIAAKFPPDPLRRLQNQPFMVVYQAGDIGLWHLPAIISQHHQRVVEVATAELHKAAPTLFKVGNGPATRCDPSLFQTSVANVYGHGTTCMCYCWFQQAHDVSSPRYPF